METVNPRLETEAEAEPTRVAAKVIKRYANRKLYDTSDSRYVTLEEIGEMVKQGLEVQIVDNRSKGDLTAVTLAQIIFEAEKKRSRMPLEVLRDIIRDGGETIGEFIQREVQPRVSSLQKEAEAGLKRLRRESGESGQIGEPGRREYPQLARELQQIAGRLGEIEKRIAHLEGGSSESLPPDALPDALNASPTLGNLTPGEHEPH